VRLEAIYTHLRRNPFARRTSEDMDQNKQLKEAYAKLSENVMINDTDSVVGFLLAEKVLSDAGGMKLTETEGDLNKTRQLIALLHACRHPEAFVRLHEAVKRDKSNVWLVKQIDGLCIASQGAASALAANDGKNREYLWNVNTMSGIYESAINISTVFMSDEQLLSDNGNAELKL
jgi:hypothetical protein